MGASCIASGALPIKAAIEKELRDRNLQDKVSVVGTGCLGPLLGRAGDDRRRRVLRETSSRRIARRSSPSTWSRAGVVGRLTHKRPDGRDVPTPATSTSSASSKKIVLRNCGVIDPQRIEDYIARDGYQALAKVLSAEQSGSGDRDDAGPPGCAAAAGRDSPPGGNGSSPATPRASRSTPSATPTKATPARSWTAACWKAIPTASSRAWPSPAHTIGATMGYIYVRAEYPLAVERLQIAIGQASECGLLGKNILGTGLRLRPGNPHGFRGVRLRRRDGADDLDRGQPRRAAPAAPVPRRKGLVGQAHAAEQRRNLRQRAGHPPGRRPLVRLLRHAQEQGDQGLRPGRGDQERRPGRGAHRHVAGRLDLRHRRRHPQRQGVQGGADRRPLRRLHPQAAPQRPPGLRIALGAGRDHGLRRPDRHGRGQLHGRRGPLLPGVRPGRVVRQVRPLPRGHEADVGNPQPHLRGAGRGGRRRAAHRPGRNDQGHLALRPGADGLQPRALDHPPLRPGVRRAHPRQALPRGRVRGAGQRALLQRLPGERRYPRLRLAGGREALRRGAAAAPRAESVRGRLLAGVLPHLRGQVPAVDAWTPRCRSAA